MQTQPGATPTACAARRDAAASPTASSRLACGMCVCVCACCFSAIEKFLSILSCCLELCISPLVFDSVCFPMQVFVPLFGFLIPLDPPRAHVAHASRCTARGGVMAITTEQIKIKTEKGRLQRGLTGGWPQVLLWTETWGRGEDTHAGTSTWPGSAGRAWPWCTCRCRA